MSLSVDSSQQYSSHYRSLLKEDLCQRDKDILLSLGITEGQLVQSQKRGRMSSQVLRCRWTADAQSAVNLQSFHLSSDSYYEHANLLSLASLAICHQSAESLLSSLSCLSLKSIGLAIIRQVLTPKNSATLMHQVKHATPDFLFTFSSLFLYHDFHLTAKMYLFPLKAANGDCLYKKLRPFCVH